MLLLITHYNLFGHFRLVALSSHLNWYSQTNFRVFYLDILVSQGHHVQVREADAQVQGVLEPLHLMF